jgi:hypothetical protein
VEPGRSGYRDRRFRPGDASLYASLRAKKAAQVSRSVRAGQGHVADQMAMWDHLAERAFELEVHSNTGAMRDVYARHETHMAAARQALAAVPGQVGAVVYRGPPGGARSAARPRPLRPHLAAALCGLCGRRDWRESQARAAAEQPRHPDPGGQG